MWRARAILLGAVGLGIASAVLTLPTPLGAAPLEPIRYGRDIRPILSDRCFICHGPDREKRQSDLRLDSIEEATRDRRGLHQNGPAIVAGNAAASLLWKRIASDDPAFKMPPADSNKHALDAQQRELIWQWINEGAKYESHWAFEAPARPAPPMTRDSDWASNDIDRFLLERMERARIAPSAPADRATLVRRIFLDLTGLPPTPSEIDAFVSDERPSARADLIDRLLSDEPYRTRCAERMAVPWLDVARYADTSGTHTDAGRSIWLWRDWVINAFRSNKPYDQFVVEQLAGDLIANASNDQLIASGFNRSHVTTDEGGAINEEYLFEYAVDRVATTGSAFLGLNVQCARCHDHKFDPITSEDFYGLIAFFNSNDEPGLYTQVPDANRAFEPALEVPTEEQQLKLASIEQAITALTAERDQSSEVEGAQFVEFSASAASPTNLEWVDADVVAAVSKEKATLTIQPDRSVLASGENPLDDEFTLTLETNARDIRMISLEALTDPSLAGGRVGRAPNGNAILDSIRVHATSKLDPSRSEPVELGWAWADAEQSNDDFKVTNALSASDGRVWALASHELPGSRIALFAVAKPFGFEGGTILRVQLGFNSPYDHHVIGRVRISLAKAGDDFFGKLPDAASNWYIAGPWPTDAGPDPYETVRGPESSAHFDRNAKWEEYAWRYAPGVIDGQLANLAQGAGTEFLARQIYSSHPHSLDLSLGSDDGIVVFVNGVKVHEKRIDRAVAPDQERVSIPLVAGENLIVCKVVNTGGQGGFFHRADAPKESLARGVLALFLPAAMVRPASLESARDDWRLSASPMYRELTSKIAAAQDEGAKIQMAIPRTMVMKEKPMARETFVLTRGVYDQVDQSRPVKRSIPKALGSLTADQPKNRLGLAQWLVSEQNPLTARVAINRLWEQFFGRGLVRTENDFGLQGEWPTHPELLDWLAVEFRESGWNMQHMIQLIMNSAAYAQSSRVRPEVAAIDPDNRLLSWYPRQRLSAEQIRDQALFVSGLLQEKSGGPSVKPYQPEGLWQEVSMLASNTRVYERGMNDDLWRRSLYTYWKRAVPPPSMLTFDAPTREYCVTRRTTTNTPLQALVLWNDEQFVEAARNAATRALTAAEHGGDDRARLESLFFTCTGERPSALVIARLTNALTENRARYESAPDDALKLVSVGVSSQPPGIDSRELAAWTLVANAILSSDATIVKD